MTARYFAEYNKNTPEHQMTAPVGVNYIFAVKVKDYIGLIDDAAVVAGCAALVRTDLEDYRNWRKNYT